MKPEISRSEPELELQMEVEAKPMDPEEVWDAIRSLTYDKKHAEEFIEYLKATGRKW